MADGSRIEWTTATWNPLAGCSILSPGCTNCYAMDDAHRLAGNPNPKIAEKYAGTTKLVKGKPVWTGRVNLARADVLLQPLRWTKPRLIFVNSMADLFHETVPDEWIDRIFAVMALCPQHTFQVLTKRSARMRAYLSDSSFGMRIGGELMKAARGHAGAEAHVIDLTHRLTVQCRPFPNVWLGVSAEDQPRLEERWPDLAATPAAVRWISAEPLLGALDFMLRGPDMGDWDALRGREYWAGASCYAESANALKTTHPKIDWVVAGGENGPRPMHPQWARDIRDQCVSAGVPFFFKQWGEWAIDKIEPGGDLGGDMRRGLVRHVCADRENDGHFRRGDRHMRRVGKKAAGRLLDGREHNDMPRAPA